MRKNIHKPMYKTMYKTMHKKMKFNRSIVAALMFISILCTLGCTPTVKIAPPDKPITINLNVKIEHEIRVKVDKELDSVLSDDSGLF